MKNVMISCVIGIASVFSLSVFAGSGANDVASAQHQAANLIIYRPADRSAMNYRILVGGEHLGKLKRDTAMKVHLPAGEHVIAASDPNRTKLVVNVSEQGVTYVRGDIDKKSRLSLTVVEPDASVAAKFSAGKTVSLVN